MWPSSLDGPASYASGLPFSVQLGLLLAFVTALMSVFGFLLKHRGAVAAPPVEWRRAITSTVALFRSPVYTLGCVVATTSWGFHVGALALAPISLVQCVIAAGLVLVTVTPNACSTTTSRAASGSRRPHRHRPRVPRGDARGSRRLGARRLRQPAMLALYVGLSPSRASASLRCAVPAGSRSSVAAGLLWAASDVTIKALSGKIGELGARPALCSRRRS